MNITHVLLTTGGIASFPGRQWVYLHPTDTESTYDAITLFEGCADVRAFVGKALHLLQQLGGELKFRGTNVCAVNLRDTNGEPVRHDTALLYGSIVLDFEQLA